MNKCENCGCEIIEGLSLCSSCEDNKKTLEMEEGAGKGYDPNAENEGM